MLRNSQNSSSSLVDLISENRSVKEIREQKSNKDSHLSNRKFTSLSYACKNNRCSMCFARKCKHECHEFISEVK